METGTSHACPFPPAPPDDAPAVPPTEVPIRFAFCTVPPAPPVCPDDPPPPPPAPPQPAEPPAPPFALAPPAQPANPRPSKTIPPVPKFIKNCWHCTIGAPVNNAAVCTNEDVPRWPIKEYFFRVAIAVFVLFVSSIPSTPEPN